MFSYPGFSFIFCIRLTNSTIVFTCIIFKEDSFYYKWQPNPLQEQYLHLMTVDTSELICTATQWSGFYIIGTLFLSGCQVCSDPCETFKMDLLQNSKELLVIFATLSISIYLLIVNDRNTRTRCTICSKLFGVFIVNFEHISHLVLAFIVCTPRGLIPRCTLWCF